MLLGGYSDGSAFDPGLVPRHALLTSRHQHLPGFNKFFIALAQVSVGASRHLKRVGFHGCSSNITGNMLVCFKHEISFAHS